MKKVVVIVLFALVIAIVSCVKDVSLEPVADPGTITSPVDFNLDQVPYDSLSTYHFFEGALAALSPSTGLLPFAPITPLFSDGAHKSRFVWMPSGVSAHYVSDSTVLDLPDGAVLIKNFWYDHVQPTDTRRILETRLLYRKDGTWHFANYVWNEEQTEAVLDMNGSNVPVEWLDDGGVLRNVNYRIPAAAECLTCHKVFGEAMPIGPKPQHINSTYPYNDGPSGQLQKWSAAGYLTGGFPSNINTLVRWDDPGQDLTSRVRAYVDINCAHCHREGGHCDYRPMRFAWHRTTDLTNLGVCVPPHVPLLPVHDNIVTAGDTARSVLYFRINSSADAVRMPLLGRTIVHEEAVQLIGEWIDQLSPPCD